ncbi:MAG: T9SS type A sorting domain-containing protein, partial [Bacteroidota bacterium]
SSGLRAWIVRSFLEIAAAGVDRAMVFNMRDGSPEASAGLYQTSGMTTYRGDRFQNKNSWYYVSTMKQTLEGLKFDPTFQHEDDRIRMYRFVDECDADGKVVYAIWSPTSRSGTNVPIFERYRLNLPVEEATLVRLTDGDMDGERSTMRPVNGQFLIDISERPKFIVLGDMKPDIEGCACDYLKYSLTGDKNFNVLQDEQALIGGPLCVEGDTMYTEWNARAGDQVIADLGQKYDLSSLFIYSDTLATANVEIYYGQPNDWTLFNTWDTRNVTSYRWKVFDDFDMQTRFLRFKTLGDDAFIREIAFCGVALPEENPNCEDGILNGDETGIDCGGSCRPCELEECPIQLSANMFYEASGAPVRKANGSIALIDEGNTDSPQTPWLEPWNNNAVSYIDLGAVYRLDKISLYDGFGSGNFKVKVGLPNETTAPIIDIETNAWPTQWRDFDLQGTRTQYLTLIKGSGGAKINEIRVCGTRVSAGAALPNRQAPLALQANIQPNPSNGNGTLRYQLSEDAAVQIQLWSITGKRLRTLATNTQNAGFHEVALEENLAAGVYILEIRANAQRQVVKWVVE